LYWDYLPHVKHVTFVKTSTAKHILIYLLRQCTILHALLSFNSKNLFINKRNFTRSQAWWYTPIIPVTWKAEAGESQVRIQPELYIKTLSQNKLLQLQRLGGIGRRIADQG
jgi:hypothetical protein